MKPDKPKTDYARLCDELADHGVLAATVKAWGYVSLVHFRSDCGVRLPHPLAVFVFDGEGGYTMFLPARSSTIEDHAALVTGRPA